MNTLKNDLNQFIACRLDCVEAKNDIRENTIADKLKKTLNPEQVALLGHVLDFEIIQRSILEDCAYRQGLIDGLSILWDLS